MPVPDQPPFAEFLGIRLISVTPDRVEAARAYLEELLLDAGNRLQQHISLLETLYQARFVAPLPRSWRPGIARIRISIPTADRVSPPRGECWKIDEIGAGTGASGQSGR